MTGEPRMSPSSWITSPTDNPMRSATGPIASLDREYRSMRCCMATAHANASVAE